MDKQQTPSEILESSELLRQLHSIVTCPVCGSDTLDNYWICEECMWEYDPFADEDGYSDCNGATITQYREAYLKNKQA